LSSTGFRRIGNADTIPRGQGMLIPRSGTGGGGEYGCDITDDLRAFAMIREPVAYRAVFTVAHDIFDNWFKLELEGKEDSDQSEGFDQKIQAELSKLNAKKEFTRMSVYERGFRYAIIVLGFIDAAESLADPVASPQGLREIKAYSSRQVTVSNSDLEKDPESERYGLPVYYNIRREGTAAPLRVHYTRAVHFATRLSDKSDFESQSVLDPVWDDIGTLRNIRWGMGQTMYRYGSGFPDITFTGAELDDINAWVDSGVFANLNARTYFAHSEDQVLEFKGLEGRALDPLNYYLPIMENISCGTGIPLAILRGVQAGALTGSEVNQGEYYGLISDEQSAYEDGIRQIINWILQFIPDKRRTSPFEFKFNWNSGIELAEDEKQAIALQRAQELDYIWNFKTRNEIRGEIDPSLPKISREDGGDDFKTKSFATTPFEEQMQNQGGKPPFGQQQQEKPNLMEQQVKQGASEEVWEVRKKQSK
jgi:hypothetical protein